MVVLPLSRCTRCPRKNCAIKVSQIDCYGYTYIRTYKSVYKPRQLNVTITCLTFSSSITHLHPSPALSPSPITHSHPHSSLTHTLSPSPITHPLTLTHHSPSHPHPSLTLSPSPITHPLTLTHHSPSHPSLTLSPSPITHPLTLSPSPPLCPLVSLRWPSLLLIPALH